MYHPSENRYEQMRYRRVGNSGLKLSTLSLGLWQNFGSAASYHQACDMILYAFDHGIVHFDFANNYGPPPGAAEALFGKLMQSTLRPWRDEMIIATKAGYEMWPGPFGNGGTRKYLLASLDQSLSRLQIPYVDIFYSHRPDPETPLEETMLALDQAVRSGRSLYAGLSNYPPETAAAAIAIAQSLRLPLIIHQPKYNLLERWVEKGLSSLLQQHGLGMIAFSPLAQGLLTNRYLQGVPADSRAGRENSTLSKASVTPANLVRIQQLNALAQQRTQTLAQMAIAWLLHKEVSSVLIGASSITQLQDNLTAMQNIHFTNAELEKIEQIVNS